MKKISISLLATLSALLLGCETSTTNNYYSQTTVEPPPASVLADAGSEPTTAATPDSGTASAADTGSVVVIDTQPQVTTVTAISTATQTTTATVTTRATVPFSILSVEVDKPAEDVRSFSIRFNEPAMDVELTISAFNNGVINDGNFDHTVHHEYIAHSPESLYISPANWTEKLQPNTTYQWIIRANADLTVMSGLGSTDSMSGEFTTFAFSPENASCDQGICFEYAYGWGQTVAPGAMGVQVLEYWLTAGPKDETINGSDFHFSAIGYDPSDQTPFSNSSGSFFKNIRVTQSSGNVVSGPIAATSPYTSNEQAHVSFLDQFTVNARTSVLLILTLDVSPDFVPPTNGISYSVMMNSVGTNDTLTVLYGAHFITDPWPTFTVK